MLSKKALNEFNQIYFEEKEIELTPQETIEKATKFINLIAAIYKPINMKNEKLHIDRQ